MNEELKITSLTKSFVRGCRENQMAQKIWRRISVLWM
jgi:hypothetical protein